MSANRHVPEVPTKRAHPGPGCQTCPQVTDRRVFLRNMGIAVAATLAALGAAPGISFASSGRVLAPRGGDGGGVQRRYDLPRTDGVWIDSSNEVILARWQNRVYAFSLRCPHRGTTLEWHSAESRVYCPKHKARFRPDGMHDSGRATRSLDRYDLRLEGNAIAVDREALHRVDEDPRGWNAAVVSVT